MDSEGNPVPVDRAIITLDKASSYSGKDLPLPYEYLEIIPAHPDEDLLYPTALE